MTNHMIQLFKLKKTTTELWNETQFHKYGDAILKMGMILSRNIISCDSHFVFWFLKLESTQIYRNSGIRLMMVSEISGFVEY